MKHKILVFVALIAILGMVMGFSFAPRVNAQTVTPVLPTPTAAPVPPAAQFLPNLNQNITPLEPQGARFEPLNPDLPDNPTWLAGQAVTSVVSPDKKTLLVLTSGYNRVFTDHRRSGRLWDIFQLARLARVRLRLRHFDQHPGQEASANRPQ